MIEGLSTFRGNISRAFDVPVLLLLPVRRLRRRQNRKCETGLALQRQASLTLPVLFGGGEVWR